MFTRALCTKYIHFYCFFCFSNVPLRSHMVAVCCRDFSIQILTFYQPQTHKGTFYHLNTHMGTFYQCQTHRESFYQSQTHRGTLYRFLNHNGTFCRIQFHRGTFFQFHMETNHQHQSCKETSCLHQIHKGISSHHLNLLLVKKATQMAPLDGSQIPEDKLFFMYYFETV